MACAYLCSLSQVKDAINITTDNDDSRIESLIAAATQVISRRYGREFVPQATSVARTFAANNRHIDLAPFDLRTATKVELNPEETTPITLTANVDYVLLPIGGMEKTATFTALRISDFTYFNSEFSNRFGFAQIKITGDWGVWADAANVSEDVNLAAIETVLSWLDRSVSQITGLNDMGDSSRGISPVGSWDIPFSSHRKLQLYSRNLGCY